MHELREWFKTPLGQRLANAEREVLAQRLRNSQAQTLLQLGAYGDDRRIALFGSVRQYLADDWPDGPVDVALSAEDLPFKPESFDIVVINHKLEFSDEPHQVLREVERLLAPEGMLLIVSFNPISTWGLRRAWGRWRGSGPPWNGHYFSQRRIEDWCRLLGLECGSGQHVFFRPPWDHQGAQSWLAGAARLAEQALPWFGAVHVTMARKHVIGAIPMKPLWRPEPVPAGRGAAQPTNRSAGQAARSATVTPLRRRAGNNGVGR